jgi:hypothetical protein
MKTSSITRRPAVRALAILAAAVLLLGADDAKQVIDAKGLTFEAPKSWKSIPPTTQMRRAQLQVDPIEGDDYPAEMVVIGFPGGAGSVDANLDRWRKLFKDKDGNAPEIKSAKVKGKNVDVTRAETSGHYYPAQFGRPEPDRAGARLLGAIVVGDEVSYFIRMVGPDKTMSKIRPDFDAMLATIKVDE